MPVAFTPSQIGAQTGPSSSPAYGSPANRRPTDSAEMPTVEVVRVERWVPPINMGFDATRMGWIVRCSEHGDLQDGWAYFRKQDAAAVATKHQRRFHGG